MSSVYFFHQIKKEVDYMGIAEKRRNKTYERMCIVKDMVEKGILSAEDSSYIIDELEKEGD